MKPVTIIGILLVILGVVGFVAKGITFTKSETVLDVGPLEVTAQEKERFPITPLASGLALVAGGALILLGRKSGSSA